MSQLCRVIIIMDADCLGPMDKVGEPVEWGKGAPGAPGPAAQGFGGPANGHAGAGPAYGGALRALLSSFLHDSCGVPT